METLKDFQRVICWEHHWVRLRVPQRVLQMAHLKEILMDYQKVVL